MNQKDMEHKRFPFELTKLNIEGRTLEGHCAVFNNVDFVDDVIHPGAFAKTITERGQKVKFLWMHRAEEPIGRPVMLQEDNTGLFVQAIVSDTQRGRDALALLRDGAIDTMSIGFNPIVFDFTQKGGKTIRNLREVRLLEFSLVTFGANEQAQVMALKEEDKQGTAPVVPPEQGHVCGCVECGVTVTTTTPCTEMECPTCGGKMKETVAAAKPEKVNNPPLEFKPYPNEHACRLRSPGGFQDGSFRRTTRRHDGKPYSIIMGRLEGETTMTEQTYRYPKDDWTAASAQAHCDSHDGTFEAATSKSMEKAAAGKAGLPLASRGRAWDATAAVQRVRSWSGSDDAPSARYREAFFWYDADNADNFGAYKLPFADVVGGTLTAIPRGIFAVAGVLSGARGGVAIPASDITAVKGKVASYYAKMREEFDDDSIVVPWQEKGGGPEDVKEGRVLSAKNRTLIGNCVREMGEAVAALQELLTATELPATEKAFGAPGEDRAALDHEEVEQKQIKDKGAEPVQPLTSVEDLRRALTMGVLSLELMEVDE